MTFLEEYIDLFLLWGLIAVTAFCVLKSSKFSIFLLVVLTAWLLVDYLLLLDDIESYALFYTPYLEALGRLLPFYGVCGLVSQNPLTTISWRWLRIIGCTAFLAYGYLGLIYAEEFVEQAPLGAALILLASALLCVRFLHHYALMNRRLHVAVMVLFSLMMTFTAFNLTDVYETRLFWQWIFLIPPLVFYGSFFVHAQKIPPSSLAGPSNMGAYGLSGTLVFASYYLLTPFNDFLPSVAMVLCSVGCLEVAHYLSRKTIDPLWIHSVIHGGLVFFYALFGFHLLVHIQSEAFITPYASMRLMFGVLIIILSIYWFLDLNFRHKVQLESRRQNILSRTELGRKIMVYILQLPFEVGIATALLLVALEVRVPWQPVAYVFLSFAFLSRRAHYYLPPRAFFYGIGFLILSMTMVAGVLPVWISPLHDLGNNSWISVPIALVIALGAALRLRVLYRLKASENGKAFRFFEQYLNSFLFLPIFLGGTYFYLERLPRGSFLKVYAMFVTALIILGIALRTRQLLIPGVIAVLIGLGLLI